MITCRQLTVDDTPVLWGLLYEAIFVPDGDPKPPVTVIHQPGISHYVAGWMTKPGDFGVAACLNANVIGAAWVRLFQQPDCGYGYVNDKTPEMSLAVFPQHRGQGVGRMLIEHLLTQSSKRHQAVSLSVSINNPAVRLYQRAGFEVVAESHGSFIMLKRLMP